MAQRRMFSQDILCSEEYLQMPPTSRDLYIQLAIRADDDGFVQPGTIMRMLGSSADDLKVLTAKRFILPFQSGVVVIKHWLIHNMIRSDRYKETRFQEEKKTLFLKPNKAYTDNPERGTPLLATNWQPTGNHPATQVRLGKDSITSELVARESEEEGTEVVRVPLDADGDERSVSQRKPKFPNARKVYTMWGEILGRPPAAWLKNRTELQAAEDLLTDHKPEGIRKALEFVKEYGDRPYCPQITKPSDLSRKWKDLSKFKLRNNL